MKRVIKKAVTLLTLLLWKLKGLNATVKKSVLYLTKFQIEKVNDCILIGAIIENNISIENQTNC